MILGGLKTQGASPHLRPIQRGYGGGQSPAPRLRPPGRAGRIWTLSSIFNFARTRGWGEGREILLPPQPTSLCPRTAPGLVHSVDTSPEVSSGSV